ncbi:MAG: ABC transporter substrate-binding protein [Cyclobacteriaceae bacterium]|nr:ABC transporter substrate-binding protein [Cyclobacteriaceae bacterium]
MDFLSIRQQSGQDPENFSGSVPGNFWKDDDIKIGLLLPVSPDKDYLAQAAQEGAELAVFLANQQGGYQGHPFRLIIRTADGLWGAGSKESVDFVHEDQVVALVTAVDGRNAHLAEQVAVKSHVVQLSTRATDETLSQAFVPWFFRIVPNDKQQAETLIGEIYRIRGLQKVYVAHEDGYDHKMGAGSFEKTVKKEGLKLEGVFKFGPSGIDAGNFPIMNDAEALVIFGSFDSAQPFLEEIRGSYPDIQVFGSLSMTSDGRICSGFSGGCDGGIFISSRFCYTTPGKKFKDLFIEKYGHMPNPAASYAYDGTNLIIEAVRTAGPDREKIRDVLKDIKFESGATGMIEFDPSGNRISPVFLIKMIKGHPVILHP